MEVFTSAVVLGVFSGKKAMIRQRPSQPRSFYVFKNSEEIRGGGPVSPRCGEEQKNEGRRSQEN